MSKKTASEDTDPSPGAASQKIEDLQSAISELQAEVNEIASAEGERAVSEDALSHERDPASTPPTEGSDAPAEAGADAGAGADVLADLHDPTNATRLTPFPLTPREAPEPLLRELGGDHHKLPEREQGVVVDLNPKPGASPEKLKRPDPAEQKPARKAKDGPVKPSRREERKRLRSERKAKKDADKNAKATAAADTLARAEGQHSAHGAVATEGGDGDEHSLRMDDLDMENPLPEAAYAPGKDHADLVMDRKRRRLEAAARLEKREKEQNAVWEQDPEVDAATGQTATRERFSLPVYLVQALFVMLAGFLLVMGVRTALKSSKDAESGETLAIFDASALEATGLAEAQEVLDQYLSAGDLEAKLAFVRNPKAARPRMVQYYERHPGGLEAVESYRVFRRQYHAEVTTDGGSGFLFTCEADDGRTLKVPVIKIESEAPYYVVDWELAVDYSDLDWTAFLEAREPGSRGLFRLYATEEDFYSYEFSERETLYCLMLYDRERQMSAFAYGERASADWKAIRAVLGIWSARLAKPLDTTSGTQEASDEEAIMTARELAEKAVGKMRDPDNWLTRKPKFAPITLEVEFSQKLSGSYVPQLRVVRFVSTNWIVVDSN